MKDFVGKGVLRDIYSIFGDLVGAFSYSSSFLLFPFISFLNNCPPLPCSAVPPFPLPSHLSSRHLIQHPPIYRNDLPINIHILGEK